MSQLGKLTLKDFSRSKVFDAVETRRRKLLGGIEQQLSVVDAALKGERYSVTLPKWTTDTEGNRAAITRQRVVRAWFTQRENGFYVQCMYANKPLMLGKDANAVLVGTLPDVKVALQTLYAAVVEGELDAELGRVAAKRSKRL